MSASVLDQRTAAIADHGERDALGGRDAQRNGHVDHGLQYDHDRSAQSEIAPRIVFQPPGGPHAAPEDGPETEQYPRRPEKAQLFAHRGVNEIGVHLRYKQLLAAVHEADARQPAGADGDARLFGLVVRVLGAQAFIRARLDVPVRIEPGDDLEIRIDEIHHAAKPVWLDGDGNKQPENRQTRDDAAVAPFETGDEKHHQRGGAQHGRGSQIGQHHPKQNGSHSHRRGKERMPEMADSAASPGDEESQEHDQRGLGQLRRLKAKLEAGRSEVQPAMMRGIQEVDRDKQDDGQPDGGECHGRIQEPAVRSLLQNQHRGDGREPPAGLAKHEAPARSETRFRAGHERGGAVQHHQSERRHGQYDDEEDPVCS